MKFGKDEKEYSEPGKVNSVIGPGATFSGECTVEGTFRVDGEVQGTVRASRMIVIGKTGVVKGDVFVESALVGGKVQGNIIATGRAELQTGALIEGDIKTAKLIVEEGTVFNGKCSMSDVGNGTIKLFEEEAGEEKKKDKA